MFNDNELSERYKFGVIQWGNADIVLNLCGEEGAQPEGKAFLQAARTSFRLSLRLRVKSSDLWREVGEEQLLLCVEGSQLK